MDIIWQRLVGEVVKGGLHWFKVKETDKKMNDVVLKVDSLAKKLDSIWLSVIILFLLQIFEILFLVYLSFRK
jgi:hypothetical protein